jgi:hypothetical protein
MLTVFDGLSEGVKETVALCVDVPHEEGENVTLDDTDCVGLVDDDNVVEIEPHAEGLED